MAIDESTATILAFTVNDYVRIMKATGLDEKAECGCCTNRDNAVAGLYAMIMATGDADLVDKDNRDLLPNENWS
jgi:hypothetical protein